MSGTEKTIKDFDSWEQPSNQVDFFGETLSKETSVEAVLTEVEADDLVESPEKEVAKKKAKEEEDLASELFEDFTTISSEESEEEVEEVKTSSTSVTAKSTLDFLKNKGLVEFEVEEGQEITEEDAENLLEDSWEKALDSTVEEIIKSLPPEVKNLIRFAKEGGNPLEMIKKLAATSASSINKNSDITQEEVQVAVIREELLEQGYDTEEIDIQIDLLRESGKLEIKGKKAFERKISKQAQEEEQTVQNQKAFAEKRKNDAREYKKNLVAHISSLTEVKGLSLSKSEKDTLPSYIADPEVEMTDGRFVSKMQADLFKIMADKEKIVALAKVINSDFDFSSLARQKETKVSRELKQEIQNIKNTNTSSTGVHKSSKKAVWDMLD